MKRLPDSFLFHSLLGWIQGQGVRFLNFLGLRRLERERWRLGECPPPWRAMAVACWNFPIYSHTFVYEELCRLMEAGFEVRFVYSKLESREALQARFQKLWESKRKLRLHRVPEAADLAWFRARMPARVEEVVRRVASAGGLTEEELLARRDFREAFSFARMAAAWKPHYLHSYFFHIQSLYALVAGLLLNLPRGITCYADHMLHDYDLKLVPLHLETCKVVVATSERVKRELLKLAPGTEAGKILVKPNGVDVSRFPLAGSRKDPAPGEPFRLVCVSRIDPKKGLVFLAEALGLLVKQGGRVECRILGDADEGNPLHQAYKKELIERIETLGLEKVLLLEGRQGYESLLHSLHKAHLFVAPFIETPAGDKDGIPTALLEAMSTGLPVVATTAGSIPEAVADGKEGLLVPQKDPAALAAAVASLLSDPQKREAMGKAAAGRVRREFDSRKREKAFHRRVLSILEKRGEA